MTYRASRLRRASEKVRVAVRAHRKSVRRWQRAYAKGNPIIRSAMRSMSIFMYGDGYELPVSEDPEFYASWAYDVFLRHQRGKR